MSSERFSKLGALALSLTLAILANGEATADANIVIVNLDGPGEGFNDPTRARPVGGNKGKTLGQQRLNAFRHAADIWGATLDSNVTIRIQAAFNPLAPGVLGSAGAISVSRDFSGVEQFPGAEFPDTWYGAALANKRAGVDLEPGTNDINAQFSSNFNFYLGLDNQHGPLPDLVAVLLHEFAHGLNFQTFYNRSNGSGFRGRTDIYATYLFDRTFGLTWPQMSNSQVAFSAINFGNLVWSGATVTEAVPAVLTLGNPEVDVLSPAAIARTYQFGTAAFGPPVGSPNVTDPVIAAQDAADAAGPSTTDGCTAFTNAAAIAGNIALVERGTCGFALKARNATNAGASAVVIYNNEANAGAAPPGMADDGINGQFVTIPAVSLTRPDGLDIIGELDGGVTAALAVDPNVRAGADPDGRARLYAPNPLVGGSSVSHYDSVASRNLLMEPAINPDLTHEVSAPNDLTLELFRDIGWFPDSNLDGVADE
jgi:PA domain